MPRFNASQQAAIDAQNQNILISAAAGSGKTTVMVEKIKQTLIRQPDASISQFLVITFTKDAAQNMKDKLRTLLEDASQNGIEAAAKALGEIETASISTIHSFCTQLLKEYNDNAGATMNPRVLKDTEKKRMLDECFTDAVEVILGKGSSFDAADKKAVSELLIAFSMEDLMKMVQDLYNVLMGIPNPFDFLRQIHPERPILVVFNHADEKTDGEKGQVVSAGKQALDQAGIPYFDAVAYSSRYGEEYLGTDRIREFFQSVSRAANHQHRVPQELAELQARMESIYKAEEQEARLQLSALQETIHCAEDILSILSLLRVYRRKSDRVRCLNRDHQMFERLMKKLGSDMIKLSHH